jgi:glycosyltransferase involved in cell wall biosynthesis
MEKIFVPSVMTAQELVKKGIDENKLVVHQWGVNTNLFHPDKRNGFFSTNYNLNEEEIKLIYVGRISKEKNIHVLESTIKKIREIRNNISLIIVGEGPYLPEMRTVLKDLPVLFTGYLTGEDLAQAYASSDIFLFPSTIDTMGNVIIEAQASGLPVIVTDKGGPSENMMDNETGFVVPADENMSESFMKKILNLCDDPQLMVTMRKNAREYTKKRSFENSFLNYWNNYC